MVQPLPNKPPEHPTDIEWELVYSLPEDAMERAKIPGGWLYRNRMTVQTSTDAPGQYVWSFALVFVPDSHGGVPPQHNQRPKE